MAKQVKRKPIERDTLYNVVTDFTDVVFENEVKPSYYKLPVIN